MRTIEFKGHEFEYDETCTKSWKWQRAVASGDVARSVGAIDRLLCGRSDEYADVLSGNEGGSDELDESMDDMTELVQAIMEQLGGTSKN